VEEIPGLAQHPHFRWVRPVQQARSQQTLERLLDSAEALLADKGFDEVTVADIAARAGLSVGAIYARFRDKEGILHRLQDRFVAEAHLTAEATLDPERWAGASSEEIAGELIAFLVEIHRERVGVLREMLGRARSDAEVYARRDGLIAHIARLLSALLLARAGTLRHPEPELAVPFALRLVLGVLKDAILYGTPRAHGIPASDAVLARELTRAFLAYLGVEPGAVPTRGEPTGGE
jgi:AcrR family transcriptional regulator